MDRIQLLNPDPMKKGAVIDVEKYEKVRNTILSILGERGVVTFKELMEEVTLRLQGRFEGSSSWYCTAVKLDLEAKEIIERIDKSSPQRIRKVT